MASKVLGLSPAQITSLSKVAIASWTASDTAALTKAQLAALTASQISALTTSAIQGLTGADVADLSLAQIAGLTAGQIAALPGDGRLAALTTAQIRSFTAAQIGGLTAAEIAALGGAKLAAMSASQIGELTTAAVQGLTAAEIEGLTALQISGLTTAQLAAFSATQVAALTAAQILDMSSTQTASTPALKAKAATTTATNVVTTDIAALESGGALSYASVLKILEDAAVGGMTQAKLSSLRTLAGELNVSGGISTSAYVQQILDDVVDGNSANAYWNGGSSNATALGNLAATSSQTQVDELIDKWFLGTDLPSINMASVNGSNLPAQYEAINEPLFSAAGPLYTDINQGDVGDCYFVSALAEAAMQDPSLIENMIHENSNGTYSVEFHVNGAADFVTVNNDLPVMLNGYQWYDGSTLEFDNSSSLWSPLIEKAYAQLMEQTSVIPGAQLGAHGDSYADLAGGGGQGITLITGQQYATYGTWSGENTSSLALTLQSDLAGKQEVMLGTGNNVSGNLVADHMFEVISVSAAAGTAVLQNPWNGSVGPGAQSMHFTISLSTLASDQVTFYASSGSQATA